MLYAHSLGEDQILDLRRTICALFEVDKSNGGQQRQRGGGALLKKTRAELSHYAQEKGATELDARDISDFLNESRWKNRARVPRRHSAILALGTDFFMLRFEQAVLKRIDIPARDKACLAKHIRKLKDAVYKRLEDLNNPFSLLAAQLPFREAVHPVPKEFIGKFIGYRTSATVNDVIRFTFEISRQGGEGSAYVRYVNRYVRGSNTTTVRGGGVFSDETLYLFGHAKRTSGASAGYRVQALQQSRRNSGNILMGPVISKVGDMPLAARIVLVPKGMHDWNPAQLKLTDAELMAAIRQPPDPRRYVEYVNEIQFNTQRAFHEDDCKEIFYFISNVTDTVVKGRPGNTNELMTADHRLRRLLHRGVVDAQNGIISSLDGDVERIPYSKTLRIMYERYFANRDDLNAADRSDSGKI